MKIAYCLYGQPRNNLEGFKNISNFVNTHTNIEVDFYYHAWYSKPTEKKIYYDASPRGKTNQNNLLQVSNIIEILNNLYHPVDYHYEDSRTFDYSKYKNTIAYYNCQDKKVIKSISNVLSQLYSRNQVRNMLYNQNKKYDCIITSRFDFLNPISINLYKIDLSKTYVSDLHYPRKIFPDNFMILSQNDYLNLFNIFDNLNNIVDNEFLNIKMIVNNEKLYLNTEEIILANYYNYHDDTSNVVYTSLIPDFY